MNRTHAYGFGPNRDPAYFREHGAERVWIDSDKLRRQRSTMMEAGWLREGDTLLLIFLRDLGGSPVADAVWSKKIAARGVTIKFIPPPPADMPKKRGPKKRYDPDLADARIDHAIWTDGKKSEAERIALIKARNGGLEVKRGLLHNRYGGPNAPKPVPA